MDSVGSRKKNGGTKGEGRERKGRGGRRGREEEEDRELMNLLSMQFRNNSNVCFLYSL